MNLFLIKKLTFTKNRKIKINSKRDRKFNVWFCRIECDLKCFKLLTKKK